MAEFQFRLEVKPLLKWDKWVGKGSQILWEQS